MELNNRVLTEGQVPWSIRQSAVYHRSDLAGKEPTVFIIIAISQSGEQMLEQSLELAMEDSRAVAPFNVHRLLIADSLKNWQDYMASLESQLRDQVPTIL